MALALMARQQADAAVAGARQGYRSIRSELGGQLAPHKIDAVLAAYRVEGSRLAAAARAVGLVERALRGEVFREKLLSAATCLSRVPEGAECCLLDHSIP